MSTTTTPAARRHATRCLFCPRFVPTGTTRCPACVAKAPTLRPVATPVVVCTADDVAAYDAWRGGMTVGARRLALVGRWLGRVAGLGVAVAAVAACL